MAERLRRRQDDDRAARSTNASLRNHRNRQRVLALQKPRLNHCATPACPGGQTGPSRAPLRRTRGGHFAPRGALPFATGTSLNLRLQRGHDWTPIEGQVSAPIDKRRSLPTAPRRRKTDSNPQSPLKKDPPRRDVRAFQHFPSERDRGFSNPSCSAAEPSHHIGLEIQRTPSKRLNQGSLSSGSLSLA